MLRAMLIICNARKQFSRLCLDYLALNAEANSWSINLVNLRCGVDAEVPVSRDPFVGMGEPRVECSKALVRVASSYRSVPNAIGKDGCHLGIPLRHLFVQRLKCCATWRLLLHGSVLHLFEAAASVHDYTNEIHGVVAVSYHPVRVDVAKANVIWMDNDVHIHQPQS